MYKIIIFDLDDTLIDNTQNIHNAFKQVLKYRNEEYTEEKFIAFYDLDKQFWKKRANGEIKDPYDFESMAKKIEWIRAQRFLMYFDNISYEEAVKINNLYMEALKENIVAIEGAYEIIKYLHEKGYKLAVATNGPTVALMSKLNKTGIDKYIDTVFAADEVGAMKPHKRFFEGLFSKLNNFNTSEMLIIGDEFEKDIKGGIDNNIDTCWFNMNKNKINNINEKEHIPTYEINKLEELKNIL